MRVRPVVVLIALSLFVAGCGGDDGLRTADDAVNAPAEAAPPPQTQAVPPLEEPGLLAPQRKPKGEKKKRRPKKGEKAKQEVAGEERTNEAPTETEVASPAPIGSLDEPEETPVAEEDPPLTDEQQADLDSVKVALYELFNRLNARDASICTELFTQRHVEEATGLSGEAAVARCREDVASSGEEYSLNKISGVRIQGDLALIRFASSIGVYARWQIFRAVRDGDSWRFDGDGAADA